MANTMTTVLNTGLINLLPNLIAECAPIHAPSMINAPMVKPNIKCTWPRAIKVASDTTLLMKFIERAKPQLSNIPILYKKLFEAVQNVPAPGPATPS